MFKDSKYTKWYFRIVENAKSKTYDSYTENHHIIPKSLNGTNDKENIVTLSYREHFVLHKLLPKIVTGGDAIRKMNFALSMMRRRFDSIKMKSRDFDVMKRALKEACTGRKLSDETKNKLRQIHADQMNDDTYMKRWKDGLSKRPKQNEDSIKKRVESQRNTLIEKYGIVNVSQLQSVKEAVSKKLKNRVFTEDHRQKISISMKNKPRPNNAMNLEENRRKVSESKIGTISLYKEDQRKLAKPGTDKWNTLIADGWASKKAINHGT